MIYMIDHYYCENHPEWCLIIESEKTPKEMIKITSAIEFLFEVEVREDESVSNKCLKEILCTYYNMKDVKKKYEKYIPSILKKTEWDICNRFHFRDIDIIHLDLYEARESCCGDLKIMEKWLPKGKELESIKKLLHL